MTKSTSRPDVGASGDRTFDENRALEHLIAPVDPVVFDPNPSGSDMPDLSSSASTNTDNNDGGGSDQSVGTAD